MRHYYDRDGWSCKLKCHCRIEKVCKKSYKFTLMHSRNDVLISEETENSDGKSVMQSSVLSRRFGMKLLRLYDLAADSAPSGCSGADIPGLVRWPFRMPKRMEMV
jgi:hypothetical protein